MHAHLWLSVWHGAMAVPLVLLLLLVLLLSVWVLLMLGLVIADPDTGHRLLDRSARLVFDLLRHFMGRLDGN
jgi:hypothetical protein